MATIPTTPLNNAYHGGTSFLYKDVYRTTKAAVNALSDGLLIDVANTAIRVTNLKPGLVKKQLQ